MPLLVELFSLLQYFHDYPTVLHPIRLRENPQCPLPPSFPSTSDLEVLSPFHYRFIRTSIVDHYNRML